MEEMKIFNLILVSVLIMSIVGRGYGGGGSTSARFLKIPQTARAAGFGNAVCSIGGTAGSLFYNPAGIGLLDCIQIEMNYLRWIDKMNYTSAGLGIPVERIGTIGIGFIGLFYGDIPVVTEDLSGELSSKGNTTANDTAFILSYGKSFDTTFSIGVNAKMINQKLDKYKAKSFGLDAGAIAKLIETRLSIGAVIQNIGTKPKFVEKEYNLPLNIQFGATYKLIDLSVHTGIISVNISKPNDNDIKASIGIEYGFKRLVYLRSGYQFGNNSNKFTAGGGIQVLLQNSITRLDYAYMPYSELNATHMIGLVIGFGRVKRVGEVKRDISDKEMREPRRYQINKEELFSRADSYMEMRRYNEALIEYYKIVKREPDNIRAAYNIACIYSLKNDIENALEWVKYIVKLDKEIIERIKSDPDFDNIRKTEDYQRLVRGEV